MCAQGFYVLLLALLEQKRGLSFGNKTCRETPPPPPYLLHAPPLTTANGLAPLGLGAALVSIGEGVGWGGVSVLAKANNYLWLFPLSFLPPLSLNLQPRTPLSLSSPLK